jgi:hypothetical protein
MPQISPLIVALHPDSDVDSRQAPHPTTYVKKIKTDIRKLPKGGSLDSQTIQSLNL